MAKANRHFSEDGAAENVSDGAVGGEPHCECHIS